MYYELYIDLFFLENFMMDSLVLFLTAKATGYGCGVRRIIGGAAAGSFFTCLAIAVPLPSFVRMLLFHSVIHSLMLCIALKIRSVNSFIRGIIVLYAVSAATGGLMYLFRPYMRYMGMFYGAAVLSGLLVSGLWKAGAWLCRRRSSILEVTLYAGEDRRTVRALLDTGNVLTDSLTGSPVSLVDPGLLKEMGIIPEEEKGFRMIPYRCAGGTGVMKIFTIEKLCIHAEPDRWVINPLIGAGEEMLSDDSEFEIILNPRILT